MLLPRDVLCVPHWCCACVSRGHPVRAPTGLLKPRQKWVLCFLVRGADASSVCYVADALFAMFEYSCAMKWTPSLAVTCLSSASLCVIVAVLMQVVMQHVSRTLKFVRPLETSCPVKRVFLLRFGNYANRTKKLFWPQFSGCSLVSSSTVFSLEDVSVTRIGS